MGTNLKIGSKIQHHYDNKLIKTFHDICFYDRTKSDMFSIYSEQNGGIHYQRYSSTWVANHPDKHPEVMGDEMTNFGTHLLVVL